MKTLALFLGKPGDVVTMKAKADDNVTTYIVFVQRWTPTGAVAVATWHPDELESTAGASLTLGTDNGYDLILKAQVTGDAMVFADIELNGQPAFGREVQLPLTEGPVVGRDWSIVIRSAAS